jgi:rod shape-determining protein MreD
MSRAAPVLRQLAFLTLGIAAVYLPLTPLAPGADRVAPDVLYCLVIAWVLRDPAAAPLWAVLALGLFADLMLSRPLGLGALGLMLASEFARSRGDMLNGTPIVVEWIAAIMVFALLVAAIEAVLRASFTPAPGFDLSLRLVVQTALLYPVVSLATALGMRLFGPRAPRLRDTAAERPA